MGRYYWLVIQRAWAGSLDWAQAIVFVCLIVAGLALAVFPHLQHGQEILDTIVSWKGACWALSTVVATRLLLAPYYLWKEVTDRNEKLEDKLKPRLRLWFDPSKAGIEKTPVQGPVGRPWTRVYVRIHAEALSVGVAGCWAHITEIEKIRFSGIASPIHLPHPLKIQEKSQDILPGISCIFDFLVCDLPVNVLSLCGYCPLGLEHAFAEPATYIFKIVVSNQETSESIRVQIEWHGLGNITGKQLTL